MSDGPRTQAMVRQDYGFMFDGVALTVRTKLPGGGAEYYKLAHDGGTRVQVTERDASLPDDWDGVSVRMREDVARAVLDALLDHYRLTRSDERLGKDYDAERKRVDKLTDALIAQVAR
jgi:hypothetical protein